MPIYWRVSLFHLLLNNANCDIWYHIFTGLSKLLGGSPPPPQCPPLCMLLMHFSQYISTPGKRKFCLTMVGIKPATFGVLVNALPTKLRGQVGSSVWYFRTQSSSFDISKFSWYKCDILCTQVKAYIGVASYYLTCISGLVVFLNN